MLYSVYIGFMFYTDGRKTYDTPSGMNSVRLKLPHNNSEDKFDRSEWYTLDQCFAAWGRSSFNPVCSPSNKTLSHAHGDVSL